MSDIASKIKLTDSSGTTINPATSDDVASADTITLGEKDVTTAGIAEVLGGDVTARSIRIMAKTTNLGNVYIGTVGACSATRYMINPVSAGKTVEVRFDNSNLVYLDVDTNGEGVYYWIIN